MVYGNGKLFPYVLTTVKVRVRIVVEGNGSDKYMNGSNVTETFLQTGQTKVDLYWPCKMQETVSELIDKVRKTKVEYQLQQIKATEEMSRAFRCR